VVFLCQNNHWAISVPREQQTSSKTLAQKALAYDIPGIQVDGNDVLAVYVAAKDAVERARSGDGPFMIESVTYRLSLHTTADDPKRYRKDKEVKEWEKRDPIPRFQKYLKQKELLSDKDIKSLEKKIREEVKTAVDNAQSKMQEFDGDALSMFDHIYAEMPDYLNEQREQLKKYLEAENG
jgi:TPP-dependent pyruvate/acetoin dehydrogenase alpha subunit